MGGEEGGREAWGGGFPRGERGNEGRQAERAYYLLPRGGGVGEGVGTDGGPRGGVGFADEVPAGGGDAELVLAAADVLLGAAEAAATVVLDGAVGFADEGADAAVSQLD